jgi:hypothetical protein
MGYDDRKTTSLVRLNSKISAVNLMHLDYSGAAVPEGRFIKEDAQGRAVLAGAADFFAYLNFLDTVHGSVKASTKDNFDASAPTLEHGTGGLSGIVGSGLPIGIAQSEWDPATVPALGDVVAIGASARPRAYNPPGGGAPIPINRPWFGTVYRISQGIVWFVFNSNGVVRSA